jgi:type IV pilus secretin PilQ/predicted competence protein
MKVLIQDTIKFFHNKKERRKMKGAGRMIKRRTSYMVCVIALMALLTFGAWAAPVKISGVNVSAVNNQEILLITFEKTPDAAAQIPKYLDRVFKNAGYGFLEFSGASLTGQSRDINFNGCYLQCVKVKPVDDSQNVRIFFYMNNWTEYSIVQDESEIRVIFSGQDTKPALSLADSDILFSLSTDGQEHSLSSSGNLIGDFVDSVELNGKSILVAQSGQKDTGFYIPESTENTASKPEVATYQEEDVFAQLVTLRFKDADLQNVIRMIAQKTGLNVIMAKSQVSGTITLNLEDVPLGSALDAILKTHALAFVREPGGIVRIVPRSEIKASAIELKTVHVPVNWVPAPKLAETLRPFISEAEGAQIQADADSNALIITDTPPSVDTLLKLDVPEKQVMIEMRLVDISDELLRNIGTQWSLNKAVNSGTRTERVPIFENTLDPVTGNIIGQIQTGFTNILTPTGRDSSYGFQSNGGSMWEWGDRVSIFGQDFDFDIAIAAAEEDGLVKVLANPRIITLNNIPAKIEIIEEIPYTNTVIGSGGAQTLEVEFKETGITMEVTPNITNNGYVRMLLKPDQKIYRGRATDNSPRVDTRSAETNVIVRDEETVVIGGLRRLTETNRFYGTPWFMDIPVIGWFFKNSTKDNNMLELVMFVTPHIIKEPTLTDLEKLQYEDIDYNWTLPEKFFAGRNSKAGK